MTYFLLSSGTDKTCEHNNSIDKQEIIPGPYGWIKKIS